MKPTDTGPRVLNKRTDRIPTSAVYCGRPSALGNPLVIGKDGSWEQVIASYEAWFLTQPELQAKAGRLRGRDLVCWCAPLACQCDVLLRFANKPR